jgi:translocation and assembly module TamB
MRIRPASVLMRSVVVLAYGIVFLIAVVTGILLHLDLPPARRALLATINDSLRGVFLGTLTLESVDHLGVDGVRGLRVSARAPTGQVVLHAEGVDAELSLSTLLTSALLEGGPIRVVLPNARARRVEMSLDRTPTGELALERAFAVPPSASPSEAGRGVDLRILAIQLDGVDVRSSDQLGLNGTVQILGGALRTDPDETVVDIDAAWFTLNANPIPTEVSGNLMGQLALPSDGPLRAHTNLDLHVADIPIRLVAQLEGDHLRGGVVVLETQPEALRPLIPGLVLAAPVSVEAQFDGTLPALETSGQVTLAESRAVITIESNLSSAISAKLHAAIAGLSPRSIDPTAPDASINAAIHASLENLTSDEPFGDFDINILDTRVADQPVPPTHVWGSFHGPRVEGELNALLDDATAAGSFTVSPMKAGAGVLVVSSLNARFPSLRALRPYSVELDGAGQLHADATLRLTDTPEVTGSVRADVGQLRFGEVSLSNASLVASVEGPMKAPWLEASLEGNGLQTPYLQAPSYGVEAEGPIRSPAVRLRARVRGAGNVTANTTLELGKTLAAVDTSVRVEGKHPIDVSTRRIAVGDAGVQVEALRVAGLGGAFDADLGIRGDTVRVRARGDGLRVGRLVSLVPTASLPVDGVVSMDVDLSASQRHLDGYVRVLVSNGRVAGLVEDARAELDLRAHNDRFSLSAQVELDDASRVTVEAPGVKLRGSPWSRETWGDAVGGATLEATLALQQVGIMIPESALPIHGLGGTAHVRAVAHRQGRDATGSVDVTVSTTGLRMEAGGEDSPVSIRGVDASVHLLADTRSGQVELRAALRELDRNLITAAFGTQIGFDELMANPAQAYALVEQAVWQGAVVVPRRPLEGLPEFMRPSGLSGQFEARITVEGNMLEPVVSAKTTLEGFHFRGDPSLEAGPLDVAVTGEYQGGRGQASADIKTRSGTVAKVVSELELQLSSAAESAGPSWAVSTEVNLDQFPIGTLAPLVGKPMAGRVDGRLRLTEWHRDAELRAELSSNELRIGHAVAAMTHLDVTASKGELTAHAKLDQKHGRLHVSVKTSAPWGAALTPTIDPEAALEARLQANTFDLSTLSALPGITELAGTLDADASLDAPVGDIASGKLKGRVALKDGVLNAESIGQRLHGINALLTVDPAGLVRLERFEMRGTSGKLAAAATSRLHGLRPVATRAVVQVPDDDPFPIVFGGVDYGTVVGSVEIDASWRERLEVNASVPRLHFELPPTPLPNVQNLDLDDTIEVGAVRKDGRFVPLKSRDKVSEESSKAAANPPSSLEMRVSVKLGDKVTVARGGSLRATVRGNTTVELGDGPPRIGGAFEIPRGTVDLRGRRFKIVEATLSLNEDDPSNPIVSATAEYAAPGDYVVTAQFTGTVQSGKLTLSAQPSLSQPQILNLIAFGSPEGPAAAHSSESSAAAGVVGDELSQGVNALIGDVTSYDISTRLDTSHEDVRPEVAVQVTPEIALQLTFVPTHPSPGQNPDRTILTLEYRFRPRWALEAAVGDEGTSVLDLLWRYRY